MVNAVEVTAIISVVAAISGMVIAWLTFGKSTTKEAQNKGASTAQIHSDIEYIKRGVDDIKLEQRAMRKEVSDIDKRLVVVEQSVQRAHDRIDEIIQHEKKENV